MKKTYKELLQDPRWREMRSKIVQRDNSTCQACQMDGVKVQVHHCYYKKPFVNPWEYEESSLVTLCEDCHRYETDNAYEDKKTLLIVLSSYGFLGADFAWLACALKKTFDTLLVEHGRDGIRLFIEHFHDYWWFGPNEDENG